MDAGTIAILLIAIVTVGVLLFSLNKLSEA
jgi:hypothetical protein